MIIKQYFRKIKLFTRLIICFLIVIMVPNIVIGGFTFKTYTDEIEKNMIQTLTYSVENTEIVVSKYLKAYEQLSADIYADEKIINSIKENEAYLKAYPFMPENRQIYEDNRLKIGNRLFNLAKKYNYTSNLQIITPTEQYLSVNTVGGKERGYIKDLAGFLNTEYYQEAVSAKGYPIWFDTTKVYNWFYRSREAAFGIADTLTLTRGILSPETKQVIGVISLSVQSTFLNNFLDNNYLTKIGNILLVSRQGTIKSLNGNIDAPSISPTDEIFKNIFEHNQGGIKGNIDNIECFVAYKKMPNTKDFYIVQLVEVDKILEGARSIQNMSIRILGGWILVALLLSYIVTSSIVSPINRLIQTMKKVKLGNLQIKCKTEGKDEITTLEENFNDMIENLKGTIEQKIISETLQKDLDFRKKNAELNALQMQINPHFLYNTLDFIRWEAMYQENGEGKVSKMIEDFSKLLRLGTKKQKDFVTIQEEIEHVKAYLKVINYRYENRILLEILVEELLSQYYIPKLSLQPLVENAILHGFDGFEGEKKIIIKGREREEDIVIEIIDNGKGMEPTIQEEIIQNIRVGVKQTNSIGIYNVNERLKLYFDNQYEIMITTELGKGTTIAISIPKISI